MANVNEGPEKPADVEDNAHKDVVFHYSRERRLSRASRDVQALNDGKVLKSSLMRTLFANGSHRLFFFIILFTAAASALAFRFMGTEDGGQTPHQAIRLGGNTLVMTIYPIEEALFLVMMKTAPESGEFYVGAVDVAVSPVMPRAAEGEEQPSPEVFTHRVFFNLLETEVFQISLPFDAADFFVVLRTSEEQRTVRVRVI